MLGWTLRRAVKFSFVDIFHSLFYRLTCHIIVFVATRSLCHVVFKKEVDVTMLCNSGLVTQRWLASKNEHELKLMY